MLTRCLRMPSGAACRQIEFAEPATWDIIKETLVKHEFPPQEESEI